MGTNYKMLSALTKIKTTVCHDTELFTEVASKVRKEITGTLLC